MRSDRGPSPATIEVRSTSYQTLRATAPSVATGVGPVPGAVVHVTAVSLQTGVVGVAQKIPPMLAVPTL